jgi:hypothetical protein
MGEVFIHIDQETGAILRVEQKLDAKHRKVFSEKTKGEVSFNMLRLADQMGYERVEKLRGRAEKLRVLEQEISEWCRTDEPERIVTLEPIGNLFHDDPKVVSALLEHRDTFQRFIPMLIELWEKPEESVCSINCSGVIFECYH